VALPFCSKLFGSPTFATSAGGEQRTHTWNAIKALARLIGTVPSRDHSIKFQDLLFEAEQLPAESHKAGANKLGQPLLAGIGNDT
jgi:hypothetical protein